MKFILPLPPGINNTYGLSNSGYAGMYKKKVARDWEDEAGWEIKRQYPGIKTCLNDMKIGIIWFYKYERDIDAGFKILLDLFQKQRVYKNDRQVRKVMYIDMVKDVKNPRVEVELLIIK